VKTPRVFVSVGSNVDPEKNITGSLQLLNDDVGIRGVSTFYRTPALNQPEDPPFINGVIEVGGALSPYELKTLLQRTERAFARERTADRNAPRTLDLDLLLYGDLVSSSETLVLPHPDIYERPFVAIPLLQLAPDLILPDSGKSLRSVVESLRSYPMEPLHELSRRLQMEVMREPRES
jgi:dihydroneopterin aldolase/2-amino-4-hydroxy-6-hydroxymethyldihydropteridine diphosphokinase